MECDNAIGEEGFYDPCASSEEEAREMWIELNKKKEDMFSNED